MSSFENSGNYLELLRVIVRVLKKLSRIETNLENIIKGDKPKEGILPKLSKHWNELAKDEAENSTFHGVPLLEGWVCVGGESSTVPSAGKKKKPINTWVARKPRDCIHDLQVLCKELKKDLIERYNKIIPIEAKKLLKAFHLEEMVSGLSSFSFKDGRSR
eukprot:gene18566-20428_t